MAKSADDIREQAHEEFLRESAGWQVDTSGLPSIRDRLRADAPKKVEKPLAQPYSREYQARPGALTKSLARMANQIALDKRDPYRRDVLQALSMVPSRVEGVGPSHFRISATGESIEIDIQRGRDGEWVAHVNGERHIAQSRDALLSGISRALQNDVHELTDADKRECSVIAMTIGFDAALIRFLSLRTGFGEDAVRSEFGSLPLSDKKHRLLREGVLLCWLAMNTDFSPGDDWSEFVSRYAAGRNYSVPLLNGARIAYEAHREASAREAVLSQANTSVEAIPQQTPSYEDIDNLVADDLTTLYRDTLKEYSRQAKRGRNN